jgi:hypothetical protein
MPKTWDTGFWPCHWHVIKEQERSVILHPVAQKITRDTAPRGAAKYLAGLKKFVQEPSLRLGMTF